MLQNKSILLNTNQLNFINNEVSTFIKLLILSNTGVSTFPFILPFINNITFFIIGNSKGKEGGNIQSPSFQSIEVMRKDRLFILINVHLNQIPGT